MTGSAKISDFDVAQVVSIIVIVMKNYKASLTGLSGTIQYSTVSISDRKPNSK